LQSKKLHFENGTAHSLRNPEVASKKAGKGQFLASFRSSYELLRVRASESRRFSAEKWRLMFALTDLLWNSTKKYGYELF
jgi:hypothetical protein